MLAAPPVAGSVNAALLPTLSLMVLPFNTSAAVDT